MRVVEYADHEIVVPDEGEIADHVASGEVWEPHVREVIQEHLSYADYAVDLGANFGTHMLEMRNEVGDNGTVIAVEPNPFVARHLQRTIERNEFENVHLYQVAVGAERGPVGLTAMREGDTGMVTTYVEAEGPKTYSVLGVRFTDIVPEPTWVDFLKIDIEGAEADIIRQLGLFRIGAGIVELHDFAYDEATKHTIRHVLKAVGPTEKLEREVVWHNVHP